MGRVSNYTFEYRVKDSAAPWQRFTDIVANSYQLQSLNANTNYEVRVVARSPYGDSDPGMTYFSTSPDVPEPPVLKVSRV